MFYLYDNFTCPMLAMHPFTADGKPGRAVYFYKGTEGGEVAMKVTNALCEVPEDDGASWGAGNVPRGSFYVEVPDGANLVEVHQRLYRASENKKRAEEEQRIASAGGNQGVEDVVGDEVITQPLEPGGQAPDPADADRDGTVTNKERKQHRTGKE